LSTEPAGTGDASAKLTGDRTASAGPPDALAAGAVAAGAVAASPSVERPPTRGELAWYSVARSLLMGLGWLMWRMEVVGREHLPQTTPYVIAPVHRSYLDTLFAACVTRRRVRFMGKEEMWARPWVAWLFSSLGAFPVRLRGESGTDSRRGTPDREALRRCQAVLAGGEPVVMFPEGTRRSGPLVQPLFDGPAFVALRMNVPIVPVGIGGSERAMPVGAKWVRLARVVIVVGKPIWPAPRAAGAPVPRPAVSEMTSKLHAALQVVFDEARQQAGEP
jgi:1-acyl-sn-glycerol-3-phosphate acyltransferase